MASTSSYTEITEEFLVCRVCFGDFKQPKILPCLHTFCQPCLERLLATEPVGRLSCPICRQNVPLPQNGVHGLKSNFHVGKLHDILQHQRRAEMQTVDPRGDGDNCTACDRGYSAEFYCIECTDYLCRVCEKTHQGLKLTRSHKVITMQDLKSGKFAAELSAKETSKCAEHNELIKFYCGSCQGVICLHCVVTAHKDHQYEEIEKVAERERVKIKGKLGTVKTTADLHERWIEQLLAVKEGWSSEVKHREKLIEKRAKTLIEVVQKAKEDRISQLHSMNADRVKEMGISLEAAETDLARAKSCIQFADHVLEQGSPAVVMSMAGELTRRLEETSDGKIMEKAEVTKNFTHLNYQYTPFYYTTTYSEEKELEEVDKLMGKVWTVRFKMDPPECSQLRHNVTAGNGRMRQKWNRYQNNQYPGFVRPFSLAATTDGEFVVADSGHRCLKFLDGDGKILMQYEAVLKFRPIGMVALTSGGFLVTGDRHRIHVLNCSGCPAEPSLIDVKGAADECATTQGIAVDTLGRVVVTIGHEVFVLSPDPPHFLTILKFGEKGEGHQQLGSSLHVAVNSKNHIIVSDFMNHKLEIFDAAGQHLVTSGSCGSGPGQLYNPYGVITDKEDNIIVADHLNNRISLFSPDGTFLRHVLTPEEQTQMQKVSPMGLTLTPSGDLVISDHRSVRYYQKMENSAQVDDDDDEVSN